MTRSNSHFITTSQSGDRLVGDIEQRDRAEIGISARSEAELVVVRGEPDIDRQHPQLLEHLQDAALGRDRQRKQDQIDAGLARELDQIVDGAELLMAANTGRRAPVAAIVEHADDAHVGIRLHRQRLHQRVTIGISADDDGAALKMALARPFAHQEEQRAAEAEQAGEPDDVIAAEPEAGELIA
jgi:hypothetical protein